MPCCNGNAGEVEDQLRQRLPKVRIIQGYGMTEMSPLSHVCLLTDDAVPPGSCGQLRHHTSPAFAWLLSRVVFDVLCV